MYRRLASQLQLSAIFYAMKALILVGLQSDFLAGGALPVPDSDAVVSMANQLQLVSAFRFVVATQDWHPANHRSFAANHPGRVPGELVKVGKTQQVLKPVHCVHQSRGAELAPALLMTRINKVVRKGTEAEIDDYSGFFDGDHVRLTGLSDYLREKNVHKIYIMGVATEHEVKATALDAVGLGFKTWVIEDACRSADPNSELARQAIEEMAGAGVTVISSKSLLVP
jgi:nicotinamidase/pyrazinamidase